MHVQYAGFLGLRFSPCGRHVPWCTQASPGASADVGAQGVTRLDDAAQRFERVRRGHLLQTLLVMLAIPLTILFPDKKR